MDARAEARRKPITARGMSQLQRLIGRRWLGGRAIRSSHLIGGHAET